MSNVIKAAVITYTEEKRLIDSNKKSDDFVRLFVEKRAMVKEAEEEISAAEETEEAMEPELAAPEDALPEAAPEEIRQAFEEDVSQILREAKAEVEQMLSAAETEAASIKKQARAKGSEQGYQEGYQKAEAEFAKARKALEAEAEENRHAYRRQVEELEPAFVEMVIKLVKKLTGVLLEEKSGIVFYLLEQAMAGIEPSMTYLIHVSPEDYEFVDAKKADLSWKLKEGAVLEVALDRTLKKGECIIETDSRVFDCSLDTQFKNLSSDLRLLSLMQDEFSR